MFRSVSEMNIIDELHSELVSESPLGETDPETSSG
jgi:hypothetical protein